MHQLGGARGNDKERYRQFIPFTDFPLPAITLYCRRDGALGYPFAEGILMPRPVFIEIDGKSSVGPQRSPCPRSPSGSPPPRRPRTDGERNWKTIKPFQMQPEIISGQIVK